MNASKWILASSAAFLLTEPVTAQQTDWSGFYAGVFGGAQSARMDYDILGVAAPGPFDIDGSGFVFGGAIGFNYQFDGGAVVGVEADVSVGETSLPVDVASGSPIEGRVGSSGSLRVRLGYGTGTVLPYVSAGLAVADIYYGFIGGAGPLAAPLPVYDAATAGWTVGLGADFAVGENVSIGAEYRYSRFDVSSEIPAVLGPPPGASFESSFGIHDFRLGLKYSF